MNDIYINISRLDGGYIMESDDKRKIFTSQQDLITEIKQILDDYIEKNPED